MGWQFAGESHLPRGVPGQKLLPYGPDLCMIKDAIANIARDRNLPSFPATTASKISVISEALSECAASARNSISFKKGLGTVDVNVLYHSLFELASPRRVLGALGRQAGSTPSEAADLVNTCRLPGTNLRDEWIRHSSRRS